MVAGQLVVYLTGDMRREGQQQRGDRLHYLVQRLPFDAILRGEDAVVVELHQRRDRGVEREAATGHVFGDFLDGGVHFAPQLVLTRLIKRRAEDGIVAAGHVGGHSPQPPEKAVDAFHSFVGPVAAGFGWSHEQDVAADRVDAVLVDERTRRDDVAL